ncbi:probable polygalacturonase At3g15720 [Vicia villosa]|uniref:probable polygalacturonase At3g15720 n=1 Tax=Vicia villosa TaxID=3911 RepID=UPI00273B280F|nr:probable polygalacturonase At3g15720 [Vicia villosa]
MQRFITCILILCFISPSLSTRSNVGTTNDIYNVMDYGAVGDGKTDDTKAFASAWSKTCNGGGMSTLVIPSGKSFLVTTVNFIGPCKAKILIQFEGQIVAPPKDGWKGGAYFISIERVNGLTIDGNNQGGIDGDGSTWWGCQSCNRPGVLYFHACNDLSVNKLKISNSPKVHVSVNQCNHATFSGISIDSPATSPNTDGFDISFSTYVLIQDSNIKAGDDCIAINGGSSFINATGVYCGPGHGISVGSLGKKRPDDRVSNVYVRNCTFTGTQNGARIKTVLGGTGYAKNITYEEIILQNVRNPIYIDQGYNARLDDDTSMLVSSVTYRGFTGTSSVVFAINLNCSSSGCFDILLDQNNIVTPGKTASAFCKNAHGTATNTIPNVNCLSK